jgi:hypothetical protein
MKHVIYSMMHFHGDEDVEGGRGFQLPHWHAVLLQLATTTSSTSTATSNTQQKRQ